MRKVLGWAIGLAVLAGCRGPSEEQMAGSGLMGAAVFALASWGLLTGVEKAWLRLKTGEWPQPRSHRGGLALFSGHLILSVIAVLFAEQVRDVGLTGLIWCCVAANHAAWSVLIWRLAGRIAPVIAVMLASVPCLLVALPGGLGNKSFAVAALLQWAWGGILGAVPAGLILIVLLEAWLRRDRPQRG